MNWSIEFSPKVLKFAQKHEILDAIIDKITQFITAREGKAYVPDVKSLKGIWKGYYRIRYRKLRIIFEIYDENKTIYIEAIDNRAKVYRKK
ncbi:type II toxin-antitoxin system RelE/ParE family toxin [bacterium]|nr:type II toxin-antitoxin system RelE/ParE family toxin [bacterium]